MIKMNKDNLVTVKVYEERIKKEKENESVVACFEVLARFFCWDHLGI
jgi:hypothetical protein